MQDDRTLTSDDLVCELERLDVPFLLNDLPPVDGEGIEPAHMLAALASDDNARVRLALIPLLLRRPDYAEYALAAAARLDGEAHVYLTCYCTAAVLLQRKYAGRLRALGLPQERMRNPFSAELGILPDGDADEQLAALGRRQADLSGERLNWRGSYEHAATTFFTLWEHVEQWNRSSQETALSDS
jgi:hypothetical protein